MGTSTNTSNTSDQPSQAALLRSVQHYQQTYHEWAEEIDPLRREMLRGQQHQHLNAIWELMREPLIRFVGRKWIQSAKAYDMRTNPSYQNEQEIRESLAKNAFGYVIRALPKLNVDPNRNLVACLITIAHRELADEHHQVYRSPVRLGRRATFACNNEQSAMSSDTESTLPDIPVRVSLDAGQFDVADPASMELEESTIATIDNHQSMQTIQAYWQEHLDTHDKIIMQFRFATNTPAPFKTIANELGDGWSEAAVRQRCHRILERTRKYLIQHIENHQTGDERRRQI